MNALAESYAAQVVGIASRSYALATGVDPAEFEKYLRYYIAINPWHTRQQPYVYAEGGVRISEEALPVNIFRKSEFYNDWGRRNGVVHGVGGAIRATPDAFLFLSINRGENQGAFGDRDREVTRLLMPHLQRAANLHEKIQALETRGWLPDALALPLILVARDGRVRWANAAAEDLLRAGQGIRILNGRLRAQMRNEDFQLQQLLGESRGITDQGKATGYGGWMQVTRTDDGSALSLFVTPLPNKVRQMSGLPGIDSGFLIFVAVPKLSGNTIESRLRQAWGLTAAEAALAVELLDGGGLPMVAAKLGVSRNTVQTQLSSVFRKSGARRQSEIIQKILLMAMIAPDRED